MPLPDSNSPPDIEVEVEFLPTERGGRRTSAFTGYRSLFYYDSQGWAAIHEYPDVQSASPGQTVRALLRFLSPERHVGKVREGMAFQIREGAQVVGSGRVTKILHLEESAQRDKDRR